MPTHVAIELVSIRSNYGLRGTEGGIDDQYTGNEARDGIRVTPASALWLRA